VLTYRPRPFWPILLVTATTASAQDVCSGPTAWICEEHQMLNAVPAPSREFNSNALPKELLEIRPSNT
jgi:hypothetical protein